MLLLIRDTNKLIFIQLQHVTSTDARLSLTTLLRCAMFLIEFHFVDWMQQKPSMSLVLPILEKVDAVGFGSRLGEGERRRGSG